MLADLYWFYVYMCVYALCMQVIVEARRGCQIPPEVELQAFVRHLTWILGTKCRSPGRASVPKHQVTSLALEVLHHSSSFGPRLHEKKKAG